MEAPATAHLAQVSQLQLRSVIASSNPNKALLAACPTADHLLASAANSFAVIYDTSSNKQVKQLRSTTSNQPLNCLAWSCCGTHLAAGEAGSNSAVLVWNVESGQCVHELKGHKHTISRLCFSPDGKLLASVGSGADGQLCIWDWHTRSLLCKERLAAELTSAVFTEDSSHILAAGKGLVKSWSLTWSHQQAGRSRSTGGGAASVEAASGSLSLTARQVNLKQQQRSSNFVDLCLAPCLPGQPVGSNGVYALTDKGNLLLLRSTGRTVDRSINLQVVEAFGLAATPRLVACACSRGVVRLFSSKTLMFKANLPYWSVLGLSSEGASVDGSQFADARGCTFGPGSRCDSLLLVLYSDHDIVLWDIQNLAQVFPVRSFTSHTGCIWDVCSFSLSCSTADSSAADVGASQVMSGCASCAADGTIRFWELTQPADELECSLSIQAGLPSELTTNSPARRTASSRVALRCMRISHDSQLLAAGDTAGNVHVYHLQTLQLLVVQEAHDSDVLCLDFSLPALQPAESATAASIKSSSSSHKHGRGLAASGSRDMLIHVYDAANDFRLLETLDEHEAEVTAVRFTSGGRGLVSCGADHSIIFRVLGSSAGPGSAWGYKVSLRESLPHSLLHDLVVDPLDAFVLTSDQDGLMRLWDATSGAVLRVLQPEVGAGQVLRLGMDPGGVLAVCCHSDGCVRLYDIESGQLMWRAWGHASHVTATAVLPNLSQLVSVGGDGCVLVWQLPDSLQVRLRAAAQAVAAAKQQAGCLGPLSPNRAAAPSSDLATPPPQHGASGPDAAASSTNKTPPGSCTSDGGMSSTLRRIKQGRPLVSTERLPRWARSPSTGSTPAQPHNSEGGTQGQQQQQQRHSKWLSGYRQQASCEQEGLDKQPAAAATRSDPGAQGSGSDAVASAPVSDVAEVTAANPAQKHHIGWPWQRDNQRTIIRNWADGSTFSKEAAATAAAAAAHAGPLQASPACSLQPEPSTPAAEQQPDLPDKQEPSPPAQGAGAVVRDLFKSHFSSLQQAARGHKAQEAVEEDDCLTVQQDRQSFSAKFKRDRRSLSQVSSPGPDPTSDKSPEAAATGADASASPLGAGELSTGLTPQGSKLFRVSSSQPHAPAPSPAATTPPPGGGSGSTPGGAAASKGAISQEPSPREKRWRQGQMNSELAGMRERLESLQALYQQQQQQQQQHPRASPARPKSSLEQHTPNHQHQQACANRRRSDSSAGCTPAVRVGQQQQPQPQQHPELSVTVPKSPGGAAPVASPTSPTSPTRAASIQRLLAATAGRASSRQPASSPAAPRSAGRSAAKAIRRSPNSSPAPNLGARRQQAAGGRAPQAPVRPEAGEDAAAFAFGSRTLARSLHRRRSSTTDEAAPRSPTATAAAATTPAPVVKQGSNADVLPASTTAAGAECASVGNGAVLAGLSPVAAHTASPAAKQQQPQDNSSMLAALLAEDSPAPSPAAVSPAAASSGATTSTAATPPAAARPAAAATPEAAALAVCETPEWEGSRSQQAVREHAAATSAEDPQTPLAPTSIARLAELLAWDSSPEAQSPAQEGLAAASGSPAVPDSSSGPVSSPPLAGSPPVLLQQLHLSDVLRQGSTGSASSGSPSPQLQESSSPKKQQLRSPLASSCSPQQRRDTPPAAKTGTAAAAASRIPNGIHTLPAGSRRLLELDGRLDVSTECRVSIGTSIAARSPARIALSGPLSHPLAEQYSHLTASDVAEGIAGADSADMAESCAAASEAGGPQVTRSSVDLTPTGLQGAACAPAADTPKANLGPVVAAAAASAVATAAGGLPPPVLPLLPADNAGIPSKVGVTRTPAGNHELWPGWGTDGGGALWEATPSPDPAVVKQQIKKLSDVAAAAAAAAPGGNDKPAHAAGVVCNSTPGEDTAAVRAPAEASGNATAAVSTAGSLGVLQPGGVSDYWVQQNPCYDMTPQGSAGRASSRGQEGGFLAGDAQACCSDASNTGSSSKLPEAKELFPQRTCAEPGDVHAAVAGGAADSAQALSETREDSSRNSSFVSTLSTPASAGGAGNPFGTPASACNSSGVMSDPGSRASSKAGGQHHSSAGGRFGSRGGGSVLDQTPPSHQPGQDSNLSSTRPGSPGAGMLGLLQRMKLNLPGRRSKSGGSGGGCMSPQAVADDEDVSDRHGHAAGSAARLALQSGWSYSTGSVLSAEDVQLEVSSRGPDNTPAAVTGVRGIVTPATGASNHGCSPAGQVAATFDRFKHSMQEMQLVLQQMQGLSLDADSAQELDRLLTPHGRTGPQRPVAQEAQQQTQGGEQAEAGSTCSSNSSCVPAASLQQRLQQEVLHSISELHATITGIPLAKATPEAPASVPSTPCWIGAHGGNSSSRQQQQQLSNSPASSSCKAGAAGDAGDKVAARAWAQALLPGLQPSDAAAFVASPDTLEHITARIADMVLHKLDLRGAGGAPSGDSRCSRDSAGQLTYPEAV